MFAETAKVVADFQSLLPWEREEFLEKISEDPDVIKSMMTVCSDDTDFLVDDDIFNKIVEDSRVKDYWLDYYIRALETA